MIEVLITLCSGFRHFVRGYEQGRTPVADVECNALIKFEALHNYAMKVHGAQAVATGHYAQNSLGNYLEHVDTGALLH